MTLTMSLSQCPLLSASSWVYRWHCRFDEKLKGGKGGKKVVRIVAPLRPDAGSMLTKKDHLAVRAKLWYQVWS